MAIGVEYFNKLVSFLFCSKNVALIRILFWSVYTAFEIMTVYLNDENGKIEMKHSISGLSFEVGVIGDFSW